MYEIVILVVAGSSPVVRPIFYMALKVFRSLKGFQKSNHMVTFFI